MNARDLDRLVKRIETLQKSVDDAVNRLVDEGLLSKRFLAVSLNAHRSKRIPYSSQTMAQIKILEILEKSTDRLNQVRTMILGLGSRTRTLVASIKAKENELQRVVADTRLGQEEFGKVMKTLTFARQSEIDSGSAEVPSEPHDEQGDRRSIVMPKVSTKKTGKKKTSTKKAGKKVTKKAAEDRRPRADTMSATDRKREIDTLIADLVAETDPQQKKNIRSRLRTLGHTGGAGSRATSAEKKTEKKTSKKAAKKTAKKK